MFLCSEIIYEYIIPYLSLNDYYTFSQISKECVFFLNKYIMNDIISIEKRIKNKFKKKKRFFTQYLYYIPENCFFQYTDYQIYFFLLDRYIRRYNSCEQFLYWDSTELENIIFQDPILNEWTVTHTSFLKKALQEIECDYENIFSNFNKKIKRLF